MDKIEKRLLKEIEKKSGGCGEYGCPFTRANDNKIYDKECVCDDCEMEIQDLKKLLKQHRETKKEILEEVKKVVIEEWNFYQSEKYDENCSWKLSILNRMWKIGNDANPILNEQEKGE